MRTIEDRFWEKVSRRGTDDCWEWLGTKDKLGYGHFWLAGRMCKAHRVAHELTTGPIAIGMQIDHLCHNRGCVNPRHLRVVTHQQNMENRSGAFRNNQTGMRGVSRVGEGRFRATVGHGGRMIHLGYFPTPEEASEAAEAGRRRIHGQEADQ